MQANLNGLDTFFGAVLGLVLTGSEELGASQFGVATASSSVATSWRHPALGLVGLAISIRIGQP